MQEKLRTNTCGELNVKNIGEQVSLCGWVDTIRDHGGVLFVDLRDMYGITQIVASGNASFENLSKEMAICVKGEVVKRADDTVNPKLHTGLIEVKANSVEILGNVYNSLPFDISSSKNIKEDVRLKYRFLDLRNPEVKNNIILRSKVISYMRECMTEKGFLDIQTPILTASSPEGARDFLVPSRKYKGQFYALPQAPQMFKQLLMVSGFDKYFQIAPCFRDEDARADRSPGEFYQMDFEMAFATQEDVFAVAEDVMYKVFTKFSDFEVDKPPFRKITYKESMLKYGSDKPDLRNPLEIFDMTDFFEKCNFAPFKSGNVRAITVPNCATQPKSFFENMLAFAMSIGMKGLGYIEKDVERGLRGPIVKFIPENMLEEFNKITNLQDNGVVFFIADKEPFVSKLAGQIRTELGQRLDLIEKNKFCFCYIVDFPMYGINEESGLLEFTHNPFSMPQGGLEALNTKDPLDILAYQYDIVVNGVELSSGAVRNHDPKIMIKAFEIAGYTEDDLKQKFSALYNAFHYGAPPHAGMAPGVDRIIMLLSDEKNIREVIAFPMTSTAQDLLLGAPNEVTEQQLREIHIKIR